MKNFGRESKNVQTEDANVSKSYKKEDKYGEETEFSNLTSSQSKNDQGSHKIEFYNKSML